MTTGKIYILKLSSGNYYVGKTNNIERRWLEHKAGTGSVICRKDTPVKRVLEIDTKFSDNKIVLYLEDLVTLIWMIQLGAKKVIGGRYITTDYRRASLSWLQKEKARIEDCLLFHGIEAKNIKAEVTKAGLDK